MAVGISVEGVAPVDLELLQALQSLLVLHTQSQLEQEAQQVRIHLEASDPKQMAEMATILYLVVSLPLAAVVVVETHTNNHKTVKQADQAVAVLLT